MEKYFGNAYRGDPGVPHTDPDRFVNIWIGSFAFSALTWVNPYMWQLSNQFNWHDKAMLFEQYHWKKALEKKQPYKFKWNQMDKEIRDSSATNEVSKFRPAKDNMLAKANIFLLNKCSTWRLLPSSIFCRSSGLQGTARAPLCLNPYSSSACSNNIKNAGSVRYPNSMTNLFGSFPFTAKTAKCPSFTSSGTIAATSSSSSKPSSLRSGLLKRESETRLCIFSMKSLSIIKLFFLSSQLFFAF
ncbi:hypothetical protein F0562_016505 [Nyssa sinensis]|uniref:Uncharacterized protein n=1 Tax=Nyssa sinensis TaxID=561372 RepID=A0A5J4ZNS7_9ASTE|nr:hypothetical protein F0562_016505 [Nyssa sinensis]